MNPFQIVEHESSFSLILSDRAVTPEVAAVFEELGRDAGGYAWGGLASLLIDEMELEDVELDCEAGMFSAYGPSEEQLLALGERMSKLFHDLDALRAELDRAPESG